MDTYLGKSGSFNLMKKLNMEKIYRIILLNQPISRIEIARMAQLTQATVTNCTKVLLEHGVIEEVGTQEKEVGRPRIRLVPNRQFGVLIGADISRMGCRILAADIQGKILRQEIHYGLHEAPEIFLAEMKKIVEEYHVYFQAEDLPIIGVCVGVAGSFSSEGHVEYISTMQKWNGFPLRRELQKAMGEIPSFVIQGSKAALLGEIHFGRSTPMANLAYLNVGWGLALAVYSEGKILYGSNGFSGRFGHTVIEVNGRDCTCGSKGCLEAYASMGALVRSIYGDTQYHKKYLEDIMERKREGDKEICRLLDEVYQYLGIGIANVINIFNPNQVCIGGTLSLICADDLNQILEPISAHTQPHFLKGLEIFCSSLGEFGTALGCVSYVRDHVIDLWEA